MDSVEKLQATEHLQTEATEKEEKRKGFSLKNPKYTNMNIRARLLTAFSTILLYVLALGA